MFANNVIDVLTCYTWTFLAKHLGDLALLFITFVSIIPWLVYSWHDYCFKLDTMQKCSALLNFEITSQSHTDRILLNVVSLKKQTKRAREENQNQKKKNQKKKNKQKKKVDLYFSVAYLWDFHVQVRWTDTENWKTRSCFFWFFLSPEDAAEIRFLFLDSRKNFNGFHLEFFPRGWYDVYCFGSGLLPWKGGRDEPAWQVIGKSTENL